MRYIYKRLLPVVNRTKNNRRKFANNIHRRRSLFAIAAGMRVVVLHIPLLHTAHTINHTLSYTIDKPLLPMVIPPKTTDGNL